MADLRALTTQPAQSNLVKPYKESPSQTAGPYVHIGCLPNYLDINGIYSDDLTSNGELEGQPLIIRGHIYDGNGDIGKDFMIESWQADQDGSLDNGIWRRVPTDLQTGEYIIETIKPGSVHDEAPHLQLWIVARGINLGLHTRVYFDDFENGADPVFQLIPSDRHQTLVATKKGDEYNFDIHLQGEKETVFFDV